MVSLSGAWCKEARQDYEEPAKRSGRQRSKSVYSAHRLYFMDCFAIVCEMSYKRGVFAGTPWKQDTLSDPVECFCFSL